MAAQAEILELVERFERNREAYRSGRYNETQVHREFLDPFFESIGWDIDKVQGCAEAWCDETGASLLYLPTAAGAALWTGPLPCNS